MTTMRRQVREQNDSRPPARLVPGKIGDPRYRVQVLHADNSAAGLHTFLGGALGRFAVVGTQRLFSPLRVIFALGLGMLSAGFLAKAPCLQGRLDNGIVRSSWINNRQYVSACYNDIVPLYSGRGLDHSGFPYAYSWVDDGVTRYMEYPVLTGIFQWIMASLTHIVYPLVRHIPLKISEVAVYFSITAICYGFLWLLILWIVAQLCGNRVWDSLVVACSPLLIAHAFTNWDIPSIAAAMLAVWFVARKKPLWAGVFIGIGVSLKLWPLYLLGAYLIVAIRTKRFMPMFTMTMAAVGTWLVVNVPIMLKYPQAWKEFFRLNSERGWEWTTLYAVFYRETPWQGFGSAGNHAVLNVVSSGLFVCACLAIFIFGLRVSRQPRVAELAYLIIAAFLLVNKVWSPQYSLWLLCFAVLAFPKWRLIFTWGVIDSLTWLVLMWHMMGKENKGVSAHFLDLFILGRDICVIAIAVGIIMQMISKKEDVVLRDNGGVDLLSGVFAPAPAPAPISAPALGEAIAQPSGKYSKGHRDGR
ncbi:glycosyltransferase family 87 protein [Corynebacterium sp. sy039]|uniref:glycosyltransferase family 87 protein n=1 Tax=Corynebacterium sp. sy039 TaxID=2599641 RepID=UPI0011B67A3C|nr:glycosyltransferase 87 family protein [Corynebacterium sp. sy039]QDZ43411.1 DUF2029 domain-containing protein [Corynebacterium sp. sy039]